MKVVASTDDDLGGSVVDFLKGVYMKVEWQLKHGVKLSRTPCESHGKRIIPLLPFHPVSHGCAIWHGVRLPLSARLCMHHVSSGCAKLWQ